METYQISKFVKKVRYSENEVILYNTLNSAVVVLPTESVNCMSSMTQEHLGYLKEMGFFMSDTVVNQHIEDQLMTFAPDMFNVIIEMTTACNFRCSYCYQNDWNKHVFISYETIDCCVEYIDNCIAKKHFKAVGVSFFGGEPLLQKEKIYYAYQKIKDVCAKYGTTLWTEVTSNGYYLDRDFLEHFEQISFLTTLSRKEDHDQKRKNSAHEPTFDVIINNILACNDLFKTGKYQLGIRYNVDHRNIHEFGEFLNDVSNYGISASVTTSYTYEHPINAYYNILTFDEYRKWNSSVAIKELVRHGFMVYHIPKASTVICDGYYPYSIKVFANGKLGLCNASVDDSTIRGDIRLVCSRIENITKIFPEKGNTAILEKPCINCPDKCLCGGPKFCRQHAMCEYNEIDIEVFLRTYIDLVNQGEEDYLLWNK